MHTKSNCISTSCNSLSSPLNLDGILSLRGGSLLSGFFFLFFFFFFLFHLLLLSFIFLLWLPKLRQPEAVELTDAPCERLWKQFVFYFGSRKTTRARLPKHPKARQSSRGVADQDRWVFLDTYQEVTLRDWQYVIQLNK